MNKILLGILFCILFAGASIIPSVNGYFLTIKSFNDNVSTKLNQVPDFLQFGDIIFMDVKPIFTKWPFKLHYNNGTSNDHCAFYIGFNLFIETSDYSISELDLLNGVQITPMRFYSLWAENFTFGRVNNASLHQKIKAFKFQLLQYHEPYQYGWSGVDDKWSWHANPDIKDPNSPYYYPDDPFLNYWYCTEIIWASYLHQGINIDSTPKPRYDEEENDYFYLVSVNDVLKSENITII